MNTPRNPRNPSDPAGDPAADPALAKTQSDDGQAPTLSDEQFEAYLAGDSELSHSYHAQPPQWPGSELDKVIQAEARKPLGTGTTASKANKLWRWPVLIPRQWWPVATGAAVLALCAGVVMELALSPDLSPSEAPATASSARLDNTSTAQGAANDFSESDNLVHKKQMAERLAAAPATPPAVDAGPRRTRSRERREELAAIAQGRDTEHPVDPEPAIAPKPALASEAMAILQGEAEQVADAYSQPAPAKLGSDVAAPAPAPPFDAQPARQIQREAPATAARTTAAEPAMPTAHAVLSGSVWENLGHDQQQILAAFLNDREYRQAQVATFSAAQGSATEAAKPSSDRGQQPIAAGTGDGPRPDDWMSIIEQVIAAGEVHLAQATLAAFREVYPEAPVSDKIRDFEHALDRPAP